MTRQQLNDMLRAGGRGRLPADLLPELVAVLGVDPFGPLLRRAAAKAQRSMRQPVSYAASSIVSATQAHEDIARVAGKRLGTREKSIDYWYPQVAAMLDRETKRALSADLLLDIVEVTAIDPFSSLLTRALARRGPRRGR